MRMKKGNLLGISAVYESCFTYEQFVDPDVHVLRAILIGDPSHFIIRAIG